MKLKRIIAIGIATAGLANLAGCNLSGGDYPTITYPPYVEKIAEQADRLDESLRVLDLDEAARMYMSIGRIEEAEKVAERLLLVRPSMGMSLYANLEKLRKANRTIAQK